MVVDEHVGVVQGSAGTWIGPTLHADVWANLLFEADLTALTGTSPTAQLKIDSSTDGVTWGNGDVYAGPSYSAATAHWGFRGSATPGKYYRVRVIVGGTTPSATFTYTFLGAANA